MPLTRYLLYVGGVLLTLLFIADFCLPKSPVAERASIDLPAICIHSDRKWPDRIVFDTSLPTIVPAQPANAETSVPAPVTVADATPRARDAFAQLQPLGNQLQPSDSGKRQPKQQRQRIARNRAPAPTRLVWRQPQFGWFGVRIW